MTYRGKVKDGVVVLDEHAGLPEGAAVSVRLLKDSRQRQQPKQRLSLYERLKPFVGIADDLPSDISVNHDHYLYGTPKRKWVPFPAPEGGGSFEKR